MTTKEVAKKIGVSDMTVRNWIRTGILKAGRKGLRAYDVRPRDFQDFCEKQNIRNEVGDE